jgi:hypothetical protein
MEAEREDAIRRRAHQIWEQDGRPQGREAEHWERAKREIEEGRDQSGSSAGATNPVAAASTTGGIATELQSGGTMPGGGPGTGPGSIGTGGGSTGGRDSGNIKRSTR